MRKRYNRSPLIALLVVLLIGLWCSTAQADLKLYCDPGVATANSVYNFRAVWTDDEGRWPLGTTRSEIEGLVTVNCGAGLGTFRPVAPEDAAEELIFNTIGRPYFLGFYRSGVANTYDFEYYTPEAPAKQPCYASRQPTPKPTVTEYPSSDPRYNHGLSYVAAERVTKSATLVIDYNQPGFFVPKEDEKPDDPATPEDDSSPAHPPLIVTDHYPVWVVGVYHDADRNAPVKYQVKLASDINEEWPAVWVIELTEPNRVNNADELYVEYYRPGTDYVAVENAPLALQYTIYAIPIMAADQTELRVNSAVFQQSAKRTGFNWVDDGSGNWVPGPNSALLGIYDSSMADYAPSPKQYYDPANNTGYNDNGTYVKLNVTPPEGGWLEDTVLYVKVATDAVNYVRQLSDQSDVYSDNGAGKTGAYDAKSGIIKLAKPLNPAGIVPENIEGSDTQMVIRGPKVSTQYRALSNNSFTVGVPTPFVVSSISDLFPAAEYEYDLENTSVTPSGQVVLGGEGLLPANTFAAKLEYRPKVVENVPIVWLFVGTIGNTYYGAVPMFWESGTPKSGATFRIAVSGGLNMSNPKQWPAALFEKNRRIIPTEGGNIENNKLLWGPILPGYPYGNAPMYYASRLRGHSPDPRTITAIGFLSDDPWWYEGTTGVTVYGARSNRQKVNGEYEMIDYGGGGDCDRLSCYPNVWGAHWPQGGDVDPLSVLPIEESNLELPDGGSSSTEFVFKVRYHNSAGLPPKPWLATGDIWGGPSSGVVLYLDVNGTGDYQPHFMQPEVPGTTGPGAVYMYRMLPHHEFGVQGIPEYYPRPEGSRVDAYPYYWFDNRQYQSMGVGVYHYFFGCSDDSLSLWDGAYVLSYQPSRSQWGITRDPLKPARNFLERRQEITSTALDPTLPRIVEGYEEISRRDKRTYNSDNTANGPFDSTIYVDRPVRVPGLFEVEEETELGYSYPFKATSHPRVTCSLGMYKYDPEQLHGTPLDDLFIRYDDVKYGLGRFIGTLSPYYRAVNPLLPGAYTRSHLAALAETSGVTTKTENVFRVLYQQLDNKPPIYMKLWINNASEKSGTTPEHQYKAYTMYPRADQTKPLNYRQGVWYEFKTKLPAGPHTYYFEAYDGEHVARFPSRPDLIRYDLPDEGGTYNDWWVPSEHTADERYNEGYFDNDYFPGPYVNNACKISEATVTPGTGKEGQQFRYRVKYSDPDGQRPYSAYVYIQINDRGDVRRFQMVPETPITDPTKNNSEMWKNGVYYIMDTGTVNDLALEKGVRRFYFEFTDNWGRQSDVNDIIRGENTRYPTGTDNWIDGPIISGNLAPTLSGGKVESQDGTANSATLWTYSVKYRDMNNDAPVLLKVYLGLLQADGKSIIWDEGHTMLQSDPSDKVYSDGADFYFQTRMGAVDKLIGADSDINEKQYYYAFEAFDGVSWATYRSSSKDEERSNSAGCMILQELERLPDGNFQFKPLIAQRGIKLSATTVMPDDAADILTVYGVYATEDLDKNGTQTNYYSAGSSFQNGTITLATALPASLDKVWIKYEAQSPLVGPLPYDAPGTEGVIPDAQVFINYNSNPVPVLIDDEKNGWITDDILTPEDSAWLRMRAVAAYDNLPSLTYIMPEYPRNIASVEGVYLTPDLDKAEDPADQYNYFDPDKADGPIFQKATVAQIGESYYAVLSDPDAVMRGIDKVVGVFRNPDVTGMNIYQGPERWQEAVIVSSSVIRPKDPYDIAAITGVYPGMDDTLANSLTSTVYPAWCNPAIWGTTPAPAIEEVSLDSPLPGASLNAHILYMGVGGPEIFPQNRVGYVPLTENPIQEELYVQVYRKHHSAGSTIIRLTDELPYEWMDATVTGLNATPTDASVIGRVLGVHTAKDRASADVYAIATNPFNPGDETIRLNQEVDGPLYVAYIPLKRTVYVKYSDIRFTHQLRGEGYQPFSRYLGILGYEVRWGEGATHYYPDGEIADNVHIQGNMDESTGGIVGIWGNAGREGANLFDPRLVSRYVDYDQFQLDYPRETRYTVRLSNRMPDGTQYLYANYYQKGDYHLHRWNRELRFHDPVDPISSVKASYFFGTKMPQTLKYNNPPSLSGGKVTPLYGSRNTQYMYTVVYRDQDGPNGQAPAYVRVYIDGVPYDMTPQNAGTPAYREGAVYTYTPVGGLSGGAHKYHFEASDGAAIAWMDANGTYQSVVGQMVQSIKDFDGPWVNNAPELSSGAANPNTASGISPWESVDYVVTYKDPDNDEPYIRDPVRDIDENGQPLGIGLSQSPRLWIDAGVNEDTALEKLFVVDALELDPLDTTSYRVIVAKTEAGTSPGWTTDQYAGKLIQISNGSLAQRVYLVQSNTADRLTIATNDLDKDGVVSSVKAQGNSSLIVNKFRINGLVMSKTDPALVDFTAGIQYKLTVPKLAVGVHKYHFTAISRETKPQWLKNQILADGGKPLPYSGPVRFPLSGYLNGPTVISTPPANNSAPVVTNPEQTPLFIGPRVQMANVNATLDSVSQADATKWANIRGVKGVYLNSNLDAHLAQAQRKNYFVPADDTEFDGSSIALTTVITPFTIGQELVQGGTVSPLPLGTSLLAVNPDVPGVINTVTGVYVDPTLPDAGNYYSSFDSSTGKVALNKPLPRGTKNVYVKYTWKGGSQLPPAYVEYFAKQADVYRQGEPLTFRISYMDLDNDPPSYHDSVQGYVRLVFDNNTVGHAMTPVKSPVVDYTTAVPFTVTLTNVPTGLHKYHFEASDGYFTTRYPSGVMGNPAANDSSLTVNAKPILGGGVVDPAGGMQATMFKFKVVYKDTDGDASTKQPTVWLRLIRESDNAEYVYLMEKSGTSTYAQGVDFTKSVTGLTSGRYEVIFEADDGYQDAVPYPTASGSLKLQVRDTDAPPVIVSYSVDPQAGMSNRLFNYEAYYMDPDNDAPVAQFGGQTVEGLTLLIDEGQPTAQTVIMTSSVDNPDYRVAGGVKYTASVSGKKLGPGNHTFRVLGHDGTLPAVLASGLPDYRSEPVLNIPFFTNLRAVDKANESNENATAVSTVAVGQQVVIKGIMKFPYHSSNPAPTNISKVVIQITKPGGSVVSLPAVVNNIQREANNGKNWYGYLTVTYPVSGDPALVTGNSLTMSDSGEWVIRAQWAGDNTTWDKAETDDNTDGHNDSARVVVGGPMRAIAVDDPTKPETGTPVLDMITIPMVIGSTDIGRVLGYDKAMQMMIARWNPAAETYFVYGTQGLFPALRPGEAIWIRPKTTYPAAVAIAATDVETGMLTFANSDAKTLDPTLAKKYRLITPLVKAYPTIMVSGQSRYANCEIPLRTGWNQFGNIFFNWKTTVQGKQDIGIPISELKVRYLSQELSLSEAKAAGWIRDYAWRYDADRHDYVLVHPTMAGAERTVRAWHGYWIKAFVDCQLIINPNTSYTGEVTGLAGVGGTSAAKSVDAPPTIPD